MSKRYRIVTDTYLGYEVQRRVWWWPFWSQVSRNGSNTNTFATIEAAEAFALKCDQKVVKYVDTTSPEPRP